MASLSPPKEYSSPPPDQASKSHPKLAAIIDNFTLATWILLGACLQSTLYMLLSRRLSITSLLPFIALSYRIARVYLIQAGLLHNPYIDDIIPKTYTAQIPSPSGKITLGKEEIIVFMVGSCTNHPLGIFAPGAQEIVTYFGTMKADLELNRTKYGMLGSTTWLSKDRDTNNESLWVFYFRSLEGLQKFSEEKAHREGWDWYLKFEKQYGHLAIRHEIYHVPRNRWENVYLNSRRTGFGATAFEVGKDEGRGERWREAEIVDVKGGKLRSIRARMGIQAGLEGEKDI